MQVVTATFKLFISFFLHQISLSLLFCEFYIFLPNKKSFIFMSYIDHERIALGNEEGLFVVHVTKDGKRKLLRRKYY